MLRLSILQYMVTYVIAGCRCIDRHMLAATISEVVAKLGISAWDATTVQLQTTEV